MEKTKEPWSAISQFSIDGKFVKKRPSAAAAGRYFGVDGQHIRDMGNMSRCFCWCNRDGTEDEAEDGICCGWMWDIHTEKTSLRPFPRRHLNKGKFLCRYKPDGTFDAQYSWWWPSNCSLDGLSEAVVTGRPFNGFLWRWDEGFADYEVGPDGAFLKPGSEGWREI
jgi:hypothetical protein